MTKADVFLDMQIFIRRVTTFPLPLFPSDFQSNEAKSQSQFFFISNKRGYTSWEHFQFCLKAPPQFRELISSQSFLCSFQCVTVPADTRQESIPSSHPHSPAPSTLRPPGISEMFLLEGQRQTEGAPGVKPLPLYAGCQFPCIPCFIYSGSCKLC